MKPKLVLATDLHYKANGRAYHEEDMYLSKELESYFDVVLCSPRSLLSFISCADIILFRNTGPIFGFQEVYDGFRSVALDKNLKIFNQLTGKADMKGKQYLVDLAKLQYPVIPTIDKLEDMHMLPDCDMYVSKLKLGADSLGMQFFSLDDVAKADLGSRILQPMIDFKYEVSFYFLNRSFQYALYAPNPKERWQLEVYEPTLEDLAFAERFIRWNDIDYGIQRVDACRTHRGELLLMEVEDLNPYLSLDLLDSEARADFTNELINSLLNYLKI